MLRSFKERFFMFMAEYFLVFAIRILFFTCKKVWNGFYDNKPRVVLFWHGKIAFMPFTFIKWGKKRQAKVISSEHKDGEIITRVISHFGIGTIRGSSSKGGIRAAIGAIKHLKSGGLLAITPDGPRGPRHSISNGSVLIPQKAGVDIQIIDYTADRYWQFKSWDGMILPKPFSTVTFTLSEPFSIKGLGLEEAKRLIAKKMNA